MTDFMSRPAMRRARLLLGVLAAVVAGFVLYGKRPESGKEAGGCPASDPAIARVTPLEKGELAAASSPKRAQSATALDFTAPDGKPTSLAAFRGRVVLLNLWATWCVPCREEMPALDRLQGTLGSKDFEVVAVNIDTTRPERVRAFLDEAKIAKLGFYVDPKADTFYRLKTAGKVLGLPTSILIGRDGCEIATMAGPANWSSDEAVAFIKAAL